MCEDNIQNMRGLQYSLFSVAFALIALGAFSPILVVKYVAYSSALVVFVGVVLTQININWIKTHNQPSEPSTKIYLLGPRNGELNVRVVLREGNVPTKRKIKIIIGIMKQLQNTNIAGIMIPNYMTIIDRRK